jgi:hypothetical protein
VGSSSPERTTTLKAIAATTANATSTPFSPPNLLSASCFALARFTLEAATGLDFGFVWAATGLTANDVTATAANNLRKIMVFPSFEFCKLCQIEPYFATLVSKAAVYAGNEQKKGGNKAAFLKTENQLLRACGRIIVVASGNNDTSNHSSCSKYSYDYAAATSKLAFSLCRRASTLHFGSRNRLFSRDSLCSNWCSNEGCSSNSRQRNFTETHFSAPYSLGNVKHSADASGTIVPFRQELNRLFPVIFVFPNDKQ